MDHLVGTHVSIKGGIHKAPIVAHDMGQTTFQFYTRSARMWAAKELQDQDVLKFKENCGRYSFNVNVVHMPYLPNFANTAPEAMKKSHEVLLDEIARCQKLGVTYLVLHLGSHKGAGVSKGIETIVNHLLDAMRHLRTTKLVLENSAGSKNSIGSTFEEVATILDELGKQDKVGICIDTCHTHVAGYSLAAGSAAESLDELNTVIGFDKVKVVHVNDAMKEVGSKRDRHWHIGHGTIGYEGFREFFAHPLVARRSLPLILETPINEHGNDLTNIQALRNILSEISNQ